MTIESLKLTAVESMVLEDLCARLANARREMSIGYTFIFASRDMNDCKVVELDLKQRKISYVRNKT